MSERGRWDLTPIYPDREAWAAALSDIETRIETLRPFAADVGDGAGRLADCLDLVFETLKDLHRASSYATMTYDEDTRDADAAGMAQRARLVGTGFQPIECGNGVLHQSGEITLTAQLPDQSCRMPGASMGQLGFLDQQNIAKAGLSEVPGDGRADGSASDDDDAKMLVRCSRHAS